MARNRIGIVHRIKLRRFRAQFRCGVGARTVSRARPARADSQAPPTFAHAPSMPSTPRAPAVGAASSQLEPARATRRLETKSPPKPRSVQPRPVGMATTVRATRERVICSAGRVESPDRPRERCRGSPRASRPEFRATVGLGVAVQIGPVSFDFFVERTQPLAQFVYAVAVSAGGGVRRDFQRLRDCFKGQSFPQF